jgi:predicted amidohydrolase YtcJ
MEADLVLKNGVVRTMDAARHVAEAVAVKQGRLLAVGDNGTITGYRNSGTRVVDLAGKTLLPGFIDAHQHLIYMGLSFRQIDAGPEAVSSIGEIVEQVKARAEDLPPGNWIEGHGYNDARLAERRNLTRHDLDAATRAHPVFITRTCGHVMTLNSQALKAAGIDRATPDPPGGKIDRDPDTGEATGVLRETAMALLRRVVPPPSESSLRRAILDGAAANLRQGITTVWEPSIEPNHLHAYRKMVSQSKLPLRVTMAHKKVLRNGEEVPLPEPFRGPMLSLVAIKLFQDGGFGAATAALSTPYNNEPASTGHLTWPQGKLNTWARAIQDKGLRISIHAIGDRAITSALDAIEYALNGSPVADHRHRIEHCGYRCPLYPNAWQS